MPRKCSCLLGVLVIALLAVPAFAAPGAQVTQAWIRWLPGTVPLGGYFVLHNPGVKPLKLIGANGPAFKRIELHRSMQKHGMDRMVPVSSITVPAGGDIRFAPGGYHLMLWRKQDVQPGDHVVIHLQFAHASSVAATFAVKGVQGE